MIPSPTEQAIISAAKPILTCNQIAEVLGFNYLTVWRCVHKYGIVIKTNGNVKPGKVYTPPKQINRLTEKQKVLLTKSACKQKTILDLCRLIKCGSYDVVWRFCTKHKLPYKMKWEAKKERQQAYKSGIFNVDGIGKRNTWLV